MIEQVPQVPADRFREWLQLGVLILAFGGGLLTAFKALVDLRENLRWKRANAAKDFLTEIHHHNLASRAVMMMDWYDSQHDYEIKEGKKDSISYQAVLDALNKEQKDCTDETERFIRDCFDWLFYFIDRIEHYITIKLIKCEDVISVFKPYATIIKRDEKIYLKFMEGHEYSLAVKFWQRYWSDEL